MEKARKRTPTREVLSAALLFAFLVGGGAAAWAQSSDGRPNPKDTDPTPITSCSLGEVSRFSILAVSWDDGRQLCGLVRDTLAFPARVQDFRRLSTTVAALRATGYSGTPPEVACQVLAILQARGLLNAPDRVGEAMNLVFRVHHGTGGAVTPRDLLAGLRSAGTTAKTMSDEGVINFAAMIAAAKREGR